MGAIGIQVSVMPIGVLACIKETFWIGTMGIEISETGIGTDAENFSTSVVLFEVTSSVSSASGSQKKERSDMGFGCKITRGHRCNLKLSDLLNWRRWYRDFGHF